MPSKKDMEEKMAKMESESKRMMKRVADVQVAIGRQALIYQKIKTYILASIFVIIGLAILIYNAVDTKTTDNYVIGGLLIFAGLALVLVMYIYSQVVESSKNAAIYNAFMVETTRRR